MNIKKGWWFMGGRPGVAAFGSIFNDSFDRASLGSMYAVTGASTWQPNGTNMDVSGGAGTFTHRLNYLYPNSFENCVQTVRVQLTSAPSGTSYGIGLGFGDLSGPDGEQTVYASMNFSTDASFRGKCVVVTYNGTTGTTQDISATGLTVNQNEFYVLSLEKVVVAGKFRYTITCTREADSSTRTATWTETPTTSQTSFANSTSYLTLFSLGGSYKVTNWTVTSTDNKNINDLFIGTSITSRYLPTSISARYAASVSSNFSVSAGAGDVTQRVLDKMTNLIAYNPRRVFLEIGTNDIGFGVADATLKANHQSIVSQLESYGYTVKILYLIPRNAYNSAVITFNNWLQTTYGSKCIDIHTPLSSAGNLNATYNSGDNIHPNQAGHDLIASTILAAL